jgi:uncharacterized membrane protein
MRPLLALALVLIASLLRFLARYAGALITSLAALAGVWYATRLESKAVAAIAVCYFVLELGKIIGRRGA